MQKNIKAVTRLIQYQIKGQTVSIGGNLFFSEFKIDWEVTASVGGGTTVQEFDYGYLMATKRAVCSNCSQEKKKKKALVYSKLKYHNVFLRE